jgi:predicted nucleotidyltransferase
MRFDAKTVLQEIKKLKDKPTNELVFDWSILNAWANKLTNACKELPDFIKTKFGSIENFDKYTTTLYTELKRRGVNIKLKNNIKEHIKINESSLLAIELYDDADKLMNKIVIDTETGETEVQNTESLDTVDQDLIDKAEELQEDLDPNKNTEVIQCNFKQLQLSELPNYIVKRGFVKLVGSHVNQTNKPHEFSDIDIYIDMPAETVPTWMHKKLHLMLSKLFDKPVQLIYQNSDVNGPTEDAVTLYDLVLVKRVEYEPVYFESNEIELSTNDIGKMINIKNVKIFKPYKAFYGLENISVKDIPYDNYIIEPKYNGMRVIIFDGGKEVYSEDRNKLPLDLSYVFSDKVPNTYVFSGEIWSDVLPRQTVIGKVKKGEMNKEMNVTIYDVLNPDEDYRTQLQIIRKYVNPKYRVKTFDSLGNTIKFVEKHPEYDGIIIKDLDTIASDKKRMIKVKKEADIDVQILKVYKNKNGTYKYEVGYSDNNEVKSLGKTFSTKQKFDIGDIVEIACEEIEYYSDGTISGYAMNVKGISNNTQPYDKKEIIKIAKDSGVLNYIQD